MIINARGYTTFRVPLLRCAACLTRCSSARAAVVRGRRPAASRTRSSAHLQHTRVPQHGPASRLRQRLGGGCGAATGGAAWRSRRRARHAAACAPSGRRVALPPAAPVSEHGRRTTRVERARSPRRAPRGGVLSADYAVPHHSGKPDGSRKRPAVAPVLRAEPPKGARCCCATRCCFARRSADAVTSAQANAQALQPQLRGDPATPCFPHSCAEGARLRCSRSALRAPDAPQCRRSNQATMDLDGMGLTRRPAAPK